MAGAHENSPSPYGTFDQGGNVMEFTETDGTIIETRRMRSGSWAMARIAMSASEIDDVMHSSDQFNDLGFRLLSLSEPSTSVPEVPSLPGRGLLALLLGLTFVGAIALRLVHRGVEA